MWKGMIALILAAAAFSACAHGISRDVLQKVNPDISFDELRASPEKYTGETILLAGVIVKTEIREQATLLELYQTDMSPLTHEPVNVDRSQGRFLAYYEGYLEQAIYREGRRVTVAGTVLGERMGKVGEAEYHYPYLEVEDLHLWKERESSACRRPCPWGDGCPGWGYFYYSPHWYVR